MPPHACGSSQPWPRYPPEPTCPSPACKQRSNCRPATSSPTFASSKTPATSEARRPETEEHLAPRSNSPREAAKHSPRTPPPFATSSQDSETPAPNRVASRLRRVRLGSPQLLHACLAPAHPVQPTTSGARSSWGNRKHRALHNG